MSQNNIAVGVDIGGSHISCAAFDLSLEKYLPGTFSENGLDNHAEPDVIIEVWGKTIKQTIQKSEAAQIAGIGFAMPGPFDYVNGVSLFKGENGKYEKTYGLNVPQELRKYLNFTKEVPIRFINDATAFALGEDWIGSSKNYNSSLAITLGTGFGSAFIKDNLPVVTGKNVPNLGCVWHLPFEDGIADDYFSTRGLIHRYKSASGVNLPGAREIAQEASNNNASSKELFNDFGTKLIQFLSPWIQKFGVEVLVIGGNISRAIEFFGPAMQLEIKRSNLNLQIEVSELKDKAAIIGSARLIKSTFFDKVSVLLSEM